jgi:hypothetical protein
MLQACKPVRGTGDDLAKSLDPSSVVVESNAKGVPLSTAALVVQQAAQPM